jgi:tRNA threonylcarbamoyladenosine biosynthesis protein TsaE
MVEIQAAYSFASHSEEDTERLARELARFAGEGTVITLDGDLGAGKTRFSQALARAVGVTDVVNSPTFTIVKEYKGSRLPLYHMDVYRISPEEAEDLGLDEYFYGNGITLIEWSSLIEELLPPERLALYIENHGWQERTFRLTPYGSPYTEWCAALKENGTIG